MDLDQIGFNFDEEHEAVKLLFSDAESSKAGIEPAYREIYLLYVSSPIP